MTKFRRRKRTRRGRSRYLDAVTPAGQQAQRNAAFAAIRRLYSESLPLWRSCRRGFCRRHHCCIGDSTACLRRTWPLMTQEAQQRAYDQVKRGGPRRLRSATHMEWSLRGYAPTNFVL
jgi:hypothetical protein